LTPLGDQTLVSSGGENLSGGQRQRIALARAVYKNCPVYAFDDPLSAVDPKMRKAIFKAVIGRTGILRKKTRLVVVNDLPTAETVDRVVLMRGRSVAAVGTLNEVRAAHKGLDLEAWRGASSKSVDEDDVSPTLDEEEEGQAMVSNGKR